MKIILDEDEVREGALRADRAWELFFESKLSLERGAGVHMFANWLWDALGEKAGNLNKDSKGEVAVRIPSSLEPAALDYLLRLVSFWADEVVVNKKDGKMLENLWKRPVINLLDDNREGAERALMGEMDEKGSIELNLMPLLGPGRAFFSVQVIAKGEVTANQHSHSAVDEYYLILEGKGTLRFNGKEQEVKQGDIIGKPTGPDATTHLLANRGEKLRILDMELWRERFSSTSTTSKDLVFYPDLKELLMRGPGWSATIPQEALAATE
jgi:uncharacterized cupin superfamily protein